MISGFLVVDKPGGITSHDVIAQVRRATGLRKVGHAGTLDPMATGVVVVALGGATRLIRYVQDGDKEYLATVEFGVATSTLDADGEVTHRAPMPISADDVEAALGGFVGEIMQVPPMVSAVKVEGERLYKLARRGIEVERSARPVVVHQLSMISFESGEFPKAELRIVCGKGTYVRVLADDIAVSMGGRAHLTALRRTRVGPFAVENALTVEQLDGWEQSLVGPAAGLSGMLTIVVGVDEVDAVRNGRPLSDPPQVTEGSEVAVAGPDGTLLAVHRHGDRGLRPEVVMAP